MNKNNIKGDKVYNLYFYSIVIRIIFTYKFISKKISVIIYNYENIYYYRYNWPRWFLFAELLLEKGYKFLELFALQN